MDKPQEAILVTVRGTSEEIKNLKDKVKQLQDIDTSLTAKLDKFEIPQGPAFINGRWEWPPTFNEFFLRLCLNNAGGVPTWVSPTLFKNL